MSPSQAPLCTPVIDRLSNRIAIVSGGASGIGAATCKRLLAEAGLPVMPSESHIVPLIVGNARLCKEASDILLEEHGVYIQPINYPTVPKGTERLRITPTPLHTDELMNNLVKALTDVWNRLEIKQAA